jgi:molybdopterin molybdotransferase
MVSVAELDRILSGLEPPARVREANLDEAVGEILAEAVEADRDIPPFDRVCMDGYALRWDEWTAGLREFSVSGSSPAGAERHPGPLPGGCVEVMTGASCPLGCDLVVRVEDAHPRENVVVLDPSKVVRGQNLAWRGSDARAGKFLLEDGLRLGAAEIGVLASVGARMVPVRSRPEIRVVSTGDELVDVDKVPLAHQIRRSNDRFLTSALKARGHGTIPSTHLPDDPELLEAGLADLLGQADVLLVAGGVSASRRDFVPGVLEVLGCRCLVHGVAQKPGKPLWLGTGPRGQIVFALPGNPAAVAVCFARYVLGILHRHGPLVRSARLEAPIAGLPSMTRFVAAHLCDDGAGGVVARESRGNGSGDFLHLVGAEGFLEIPPGHAAPAGSVARFWPW